MNQVYLIEEAHLCDDGYYQARPHTVGVYASEPMAQDLVAKYEKECRLDFEKQRYAGRGADYTDDDLWEHYAYRRVTGTVIQYETEGAAK